jgi:hypothetical protein
VEDPQAPVPSARRDDLAALDALVAAAPDGPSRLALLRDFAVQALRRARHLEWQGYYAVYRIKEADLWRHALDQEYRTFEEWVTQLCIDYGFSRRTIFERLAAIRLALAPAGLALPLATLFETAPGKLYALRRHLNVDPRSGAIEAPSPGRLGPAEAREVFEEMRPLSVSESIAHLYDRVGSSGIYFQADWEEWEDEGVDPETGEVCPQAFLRLRAVYVVDETGRRHDLFGPLPRRLAHRFLSKIGIRDLDRT